MTIKKFLEDIAAGEEARQEGAKVYVSALLEFPGEKFYVVKVPLEHVGTSITTGEILLEPEIIKVDV